jgi:osmotically-inducible protein OsmY
MSTRYGGREFERDDETTGERDYDRRDERHTGRDYGFERKRYARTPDYGSSARGYRRSRDDYDDDYTRGYGGYTRDYGRTYERDSDTRSYGRDYGTRYRREGGYSGLTGRGYDYGGTGRDYRRDYGRTYERESVRGDEDEPIRSFDTDYGRTTSRFYGRSGYDYGRDDYDEREEERARREFRGRGRGDRGWWDRAADEVLSWFGDEEAVRRRRMDEGRESNFRGRGPKNYRRSDERIREDINDRLTDNDWIDASDVEVSVLVGEVTLSGTVDSRYAKRVAEDIADSVSGVTNVQNNLRVKDRRVELPETTTGATGAGVGATDIKQTGASDLPETGKASRAAGGTVK